MQTGKHSDMQSAVLLDRISKIISFKPDTTDNHFTHFHCNLLILMQFLKSGEFENRILGEVSSIVFLDSLPTSKSIRWVC